MLYHEPDDLRFLIAETPVSASIITAVSPSKIDIATLKKTTHYKRLDIKNVPTEVNDKVEDIFNMLKDSNDKVITKTANIIVNKAASKK